MFWTGHDPAGYVVVQQSGVVYRYRISGEARRKLNQKLYESLKENGVLFIGGRETMLDASQTGFQRLYPCFWGKSAVSAPQKAPARIGALSKI